MYSTVAPPDQTNVDNNKDGAKERDKPLSGVSESNWKKFQELKKRREQSCKRSDGKGRRGNMRKTRNHPVSQVQSELSILREYGVDPSRCDNKDSISQQTKKSQPKKIEEQWNNLKQYIPNNSTLESNEKCSQEKKREEEISEAIRNGKYDEAESLSEQLVTRDFVVKMASAVESRDFAKRRHEQQEKAQRSKKTKLHWGFEQKERWESKGNM